MLVEDDVKALKNDANARQSTKPGVPPTLAQIVHTLPRLRPIQVEGVQWLDAMFRNGLNPILCDVMGVGKTAQLAAYMLYLHKHYPHFQKFLVVCPLVIRAVWQKELTLLRGLPSDMVEIVTYEATLVSGGLPQTTVWDYVVFDEAHHLLQNTQTRAIASRLIAPRCALITGTPFESDVADVYKLLSFANPEIFPPTEHAADIIERMAADDGTGRPKATVFEPFILRRATPDGITPTKKLIEYDWPATQTIVQLLHDEIPLDAKTVIFSTRLKPVRERTCIAMQCARLTQPLPYPHAMRRSKNWSEPSRMRRSTSLSCAAKWTRSSASRRFASLQTCPLSESCSFPRWRPARAST